MLVFYILLVPIAYFVDIFSGYNLILGNVFMFFFPAFYLEIHEDTVQICLLTFQATA